MIGDIDIIIRLVLSAVLGALVGYERERQSQPAGLRTHVILVVGSALAMTMSVNIAMEFRPLVPNGDPARLAAQVISGIGFLGAGAILRFGPTVKGLTTATSLWTMAIVGLAVGAGYYIPAVAATALLLISLVLLNVLENRFIRPFITLTISLKADDRNHLIDDLKRAITEHGGKLLSTSVKKNLEDKRVAVDLTIRTNESGSIDLLIERLSGIKGVRSFEIS